MAHLFTSDLHFTDNPRDSYRWELFPFLKRVAQKKGVTDIWLLGDITDAKDRHPARLVNRIMDELVSLQKESECFVHIVKGNHDYVDPDTPFFRFISESEMRFYNQAAVCAPDRAGDVLILPHTRNPDEDWAILDEGQEVELVVTHMTFDGSDAGGFIMEGMPKDYITKRCPSLKGVPIISGDIHVPQTLGPIRYCGSPYHVHFGDTFQPRVLLYEEGKFTSVKHSSLSRHTFNIMDPEELYDANVYEGDQVKVRLSLMRSQFGQWEEHRKRINEIATELGLEIFAIELKPRMSRKKPKLNKQTPTLIESDKSTPEELFSAFCKERGIEKNLTQGGLKILGADK
jgi:hypothetical protein